MIGGQEADTVQVDLEHNGLERGPFQKRRVDKRPWVRVGGGSTVLLWTAFLVPPGAPAFTRSLAGPHSAPRLQPRKKPGCSGRVNPS